MEYSREHFINRELSWLEFNKRVQAEARDASNPLLERLKFLAIAASNLDEFYEVRVAGLMQQKQIGSAEVGPDGLSASEQLDAIRARVESMVRGQYACWNTELVPALEEEGIRFLTYPDVPAAQAEYFERYFRESLYPVLTPLAIDPGHPFPQLLNKSLNVVLELHGEDLLTDLAIVQVPRILPRVVAVPGTPPGRYDFVFIGNLIQHHASALFHGVEVRGVHQFRVTRNSNLYVDEEEAANLLRAIETELRKLNRGKAVRLEVQEDCPEEVRDRLLRIFGLQSDDLCVVDGPINLMRLMPVGGAIGRPDLKYKPFTPVDWVPGGDPACVFAEIRQGDVLVHHPFDSFDSVVDFVQEAAEDPDVLAIKQTLYRTSGDSPIVRALIRAAENGKQVSVIIELKARFDEAANIQWARLMQEAGVNVVYGLVGLKTHCKVALVVRKEGETLRRYAHIATGNYHSATARFYTDLGLFTADETITRDVAELFNLLTGVSKFPGMGKLLVAPYNLHERMVTMIRAEQSNAEAGRPAGIFAKMNSLVEEDVISALYDASRAGVKVRLMVRGMCCLRPGVPGLSENIEVRSVVGRFLEHSRLFRFESGGEPQIYLGSADWMPRNFFRRIEACVPLETPAVRARVASIIEKYWEDNVKARVLRSDGHYVPRRRGRRQVEAQQLFVKDAARRRLTARTSPIR